MTAKIALVMGANKGIGLETARQLAKSGIHVILAARDGAKGTAAAQKLKGEGLDVEAIALDVSNAESIAAAVKEVGAKHGRLDILINNAGINITSFRRPDAKDIGKFRDVTPQEFRRIVEVNVIAPFLMTRSALAPMLKQGWGRIINVTTSLDMMWRNFMQPYGGSKAANEAHLAAIALELEGSGVTANVLVPGGAANTRMVTPGLVPDRSKLIAPEVMVAPLVWLCSNASDGVTGQRFIGARWDDKLPPAEAAKKAGAPAAWQQLGVQAIMPDEMR